MINEPSQSACRPVAVFYGLLGSEKKIFFVWFFLSVIYWWSDCRQINIRIEMIMKHMVDKKLNIITESTYNNCEHEKCSESNLSEFSLITELFADTNNVYKKPRLMYHILGDVWGSNWVNELFSLYMTVVNKVIKYHKIVFFLYWLLELQPG